MTDFKRHAERLRYLDARIGSPICLEAADAIDQLLALAKPASTPAGGDVVGLVAAIIDPEIWAIEQPIPTRGHVEDFHQRRRSSCELAQRVIAALSQSTSAGPTDAEIEAEIAPMSYEGADLTECAARVRALFGSTSAGRVGE